MSPLDRCLAIREVITQALAGMDLFAVAESKIEADGVCCVVALFEPETCEPVVIEVECTMEAEAEAA